LRGSVEVHRYLTERAIPHEFYRLQRPLRRVDEASAVLGLDPQIVVAAELFEERDARLLALTSASACASAEALALAAGLRRARPMSKTRIAAYTGFIADWLPPVGHERPSRAFLDPSLLEADVLYTPGGDPGLMLVLHSSDLLRATAGIVAPLEAPVPAEASDQTARAAG
jgi:prolyl-tRNA editing enzyme YbaK/EbsC (Cys-tRNA(Pro) deacylase)